MGDVPYWVYAALCHWADENGNVRCVKWHNHIKLYTKDTGEYIGRAIIITDGE